MANNSVNINVNVSDNGTVKAVTKKVQDLKDLLTQTASIASSISLGGVVSGGTTRATGGTRSSRAASTMAPSGGAASSAATGGTYAQARATMGTGAEARDFAKQSEGLGGLVRLYATYAANIYAAGAAFRALSEAANTANIVQGLNQLGATSGVALGTLSKQFAEASGGAISLREAMQATAQATSAGLTAKQFLQLGDVAKKASQALGINMSDAVSRLTRGITKMEPELLDELGIFTKLGKSTEDYAKSIGKTASSLTDFEKRQAFANAVLKEGSDKFSDINIPTNPYDKLSASLANLSYESLTVVNKALLPLVDALSKSPGTLLAIVTSLALVMVKQAIPALTQFRAGMEANANAAKAHALETNNVIAGLRQSGAAMTTHEAVMQRVANNATKTAASYTILSNAIENTHTSGATDAFKLLRAELALNTAGFGFFTRAALLTRGALAILVTGIGSLVSAFAGPIILITTLITGFKLLAEYLSDNSEQVGKYTDAIKTQDEYTKALIATSEKYAGVLTADSIIAKATAFGNLADGVIATATALQEAEAKSGWLDNILNYVKSKYSGDLRSVFAEATTSSIIQGLQAIDDQEIRKQAEASIRGALGLDDVEQLTAETIKKALKTANLAKVKAAEEANKNRVTAATGPLQGLSDGFKEVNKDFQDLSNSLVNNDPLSKFGLALVKQTELMATAFSKPTTALAELNSIMKDTSQIKAFPPESQKAILEVARKYKEISDDIALYKSRVEAARAAQKEGIRNEVVGSVLRLSSNMPDDSRGGTGGGMMRQSAATMEARSKWLLAQAEQKQKDLDAQLVKALAEATETGFKLIEGPLTRAIAQAGIDTQKTLLGYLPKTPGAVAISADLEIQSIELKKEEIKSQRELIDAINLARLADDRRAMDAELKLVRFESEAGQAIVKRMQENTAQREAILDPSKINRKTASAAVGSIYQQNVGYQTKLKELESQETQIRIKEAVDVAIAEIDKVITESQDRLDDLAKSNVNYFKSAAFTRMSDIAQLDEKTRRAKDEQEKSDAIAREKASKDTRRAEVVASLARDPKTKALAEEAAKYAKGRETVLISQQEAAKELADIAAKDARTQLLITKNLEEQLALLDDNSKLADIQSQRDSQELDAAAQKLDFELSLGKLSKDEYQTQKRINDLKNLELDTTNQLRKAAENYNKEQLEIEKKLADKAAAPEGSDRQLELINQRIASKELYQSGVEGIKAAAALKAEGIKLLSSVDERTQTYADAFKGTVDSMSDALVDFAMTGKASFSDLIQSMILDLIKFEQRKMMTSVFESFGGFSGIAGSIVGSLFGPSTATAAELANNGGWGDAGGSMRVPKALGGVYDQGVEMFAKGGAFSNTIVTRPTTFAFAKGTGLMGEAGPEAIMPLKRGANGSLGVQGGGGGNVDVVVNNYGSEKASTKESTDARGNRRIEVIIGELTAAEMSRPNSPVQASMRGTFGISPQLNRR